MSLKPRSSTFAITISPASARRCGGVLNVKVTFDDEEPLLHYPAVNIVVRGHRDKYQQHVLEKPSTDNPDATAPEDTSRSAAAPSLNNG